MGRDLWMRPYGRFYFLPKFLADFGHDVWVHLLDYGRRDSFDRWEKGVRWISTSLLHWNPTEYGFRSLRLAKEMRADFVVGCSDIYFGLSAVWIKSKIGVMAIIDAYDNFESYIPLAKPLHLLWRAAVREADLVTAAGPNLAELLDSIRETSSAVVVPMAADPDFRPTDIRNARKKLGFSINEKFIGYFGSINRSRNVGELFDAYSRIRNQERDVKLLLSGNISKRMTLRSGIEYLGYVEDKMMPDLLNSVDVVAVTVAPTNFGNYSYPVKLYEAIACERPVVATKTPATQWILRNQDGWLVNPGDVDQLSRKLAAAIGTNSLKKEPIPHASTWDISARILEKSLESLS